MDFFTWDGIGGLLNSNFISALAGALTGAFAGAMAAHRIADRARQREAMLAEIRSTNAAIMVAFTICNAGLALKKQQIHGIYEAYTAKKAELEELLRRRAAGEQAADRLFELQADLRNLQMPLVPIDVLRDQVYEKISAAGRPLALVAALSGSIAGLADVMEKRSGLIERFRDLGEAGAAKLPALYFGKPYGPGHVSTEFADAIESLHRLNDDVIFFSHLLISDLKVHGQRVLAQYKKIATAKKEKIHDVDITDARVAGMMPEPGNYEDWLQGFPDEPPPAGEVGDKLRR